MWNSTCRCRWLAILPPFRSYDPELSCTARQMIVYLVFGQPYPTHGHVLRISRSRSPQHLSQLVYIYTAICCFYTSSFDLFWVLYLIVFLLSGPVSARQRSAFRDLPLLDKRQYSASCLMIHTSGLCAPVICPVSVYLLYVYPSLCHTLIFVTLTFYNNGVLLLLCTFSINVLVLS